MNLKNKPLFGTILLITILFSSSAVSMQPPSLKELSTKVVKSSAGICLPEPCDDGDHTRKSARSLAELCRPKITRDALHARTVQAFIDTKKPGPFKAYMIKFLQEIGTEIRLIAALHQKDYRTLDKYLCMAASWGDLKTVKALCRFPNIIVNTQYNDVTPLSAACATGQREVVHFLLEKGARVNIFTQNPANRPLELALATENFEIVQLLIEHSPKELYTASL